MINAKPAGSDGIDYPLVPSIAGAERDAATEAVCSDGVKRSAGNNNNDDGQRDGAPERVEE
jgi:hypothetical protein